MEGKFNLKNLLCILLLVFCYPLGLISIWFISSWKKDVKFLITASIIIPLSFFILPIYLPSCKITPYLSLIAAIGLILTLVLISLTFLLTKRGIDTRSLWIRTFYFLEFIIIIAGSLLISGVLCFYKPGIPTPPLPEREAVEQILIKRVSGGLAGLTTEWVTEWVKISKGNNNWGMERCQSNNEGFVCCKQVLEDAATANVLEGIKNTDTSVPNKPIILDVYSKYKVSIDTTHRQIWLESVSNMPAGWNVISQTKNRRELFQMGGEEFMDALSRLPQCEGKEKRESLDWEISQPPSLLDRYSPQALPDLKIDEDTTFEFFQPFGDSGKQFGILDLLNKAWLARNVPSYLNSPSIELLILAFKDQEGMRAFQQHLFQIYSAISTATKVEEVTIEELPVKKYNFYAGSTELLEEPFEEGDVTLLTFSKKNLLFFIIGTQHLREQSSDELVNLLVRNLKLDVEDPSYFYEGEVVTFEASPAGQEKTSSNVDRCLDLDSRVERYECIDRVARVTGDNKTCNIYLKSTFDYLENPKEYVELCLINAAVGRKDPSVCESLEIFTKQECLDTYYLKLTTKETGDFSCQAIEDNNKYHWCLEDLVDSTGDISWCEKARDEYYRSWCYRDHAVSPEDCDKISSPSRDYCLERLAIQNNQPSLCERIDDNSELSKIIKQRCLNAF